jgi:hypothetical protein
MPEQFSFDLKQLVRVCLNDPDLRAEIFAGIDEGPMPVRTPCALVSEGQRTWSGILKSDREKSPGDAGFLVRDGMGWLSGRLTEVLRAEADQSTITADEMNKRMKP